MRMLLLFAVVAVLHFILSVLGALFTLPVAFDTRGGLAPDPVKALLVSIASILLAPVSWIGPLVPSGLGRGYGEIAIASALFGAAAVGIATLWRVVRRGKAKADVAA